MNSESSNSSGLGVAIRDVGLRFAAPGGGVEALAGCSLEIAAGSFTVIIGPNGCGKSTLLRLIAGLLQPTAGAVAVDGRAPLPGDGRVGLAFQQPRLIPWRTTLDNVALPLELAGVPMADRRARASGALDRVGLGAAATLRPRELSGGMAQRAALARALIADPPVLLLDEPFSSLDALTRETFDSELQRLWIERQRTVIFVTHSVSEAIALADRVVVMTPRPGRVARVVEVDLPRPRPAELLGDRRASELAARGARGADGGSRDRAAAMGRAGGGGVRRIGAGILSLAVFLAIWKLVTVIGGYPDYILPPPEAVAERGWRAIGTGILWEHTAVTLLEIVLGFAVGAAAAVVTGTALGKSLLIERVLSPYIVAAQAVPILALAPLLDIWFGGGLLARVVICALIVFFPIAIATMVGIRSTDPLLTEMLRSLGATDTQRTRMLEIPSALPVIFGGLRVGVTLAVIGAVVAEWAGASTGLGVLINIANQGLFDTPLMFVALATLAIIGLVFYGLVVLVERRLLSQ